MSYGMVYKGLGLLAATSLIMSCGPGEDGDEGAEETQTRALELQFEGVVGEQAFSCEETYALGMNQTMAQLTDFKLYVHNVRLMREGGEEVEVTLTPDEKWQADGVALLDFEDKAGACANGTPDVNARVVGEVADHDDYVGVKFDVGIPFDLNHADVGALPSPMNITSMFWSWQGGRKFVRIDGKVEEDALRFHLGSTACEGEAGDIKQCGNPNRPEIALEGLDPFADTIAVDAAALFEGVDLTPAEGKSAICMSAPDTPECGPMFSALGMKHGMGNMNAEQTFFRVRKK